MSKTFSSLVDKAGNVWVIKVRQTGAFEHHEYVKAPDDGKRPLA